MLNAPDIEALVAQAAAVLDRAAVPFLAGHRAGAAVHKQGHDFATEMDLAIERQVAAELQAATGIGVHGEEFGGASLDDPLVWVVDPIDGTFNYAAGSPMASILLALMRDGQPVAGLTWLPFIGQRYTATAGGPLMCDGVALPELAPAGLAKSIVGVGSFNVLGSGRYPGRWRLAVCAELSRVVSSKIRMHGSPGIHMAYVGSGILGAAVHFGGEAWDHAAGVALVRAAGGIVTDLAGEPWTPATRGILAAAPGVYDEVLAILRRVGPPEEYR